MRDSMRGYFAGIVAAVAVMAMLLVPIAADDSDAATIDTDSIEWEFNTDDGGYISFVIDNSGGSRFYVDVRVYEGNDLVGSADDVTVNAGISTVTVNMSGFRESGDHTLRVVVEADPSSSLPDGQNSFNVQVTVETSLLSSWVTYAVIIIVVIVIVIFAYLKIRDSPKKTSDMTFEQLEEERKAEMAAKSERKKRSSSSGASTERQMYLANKKKNEKQ